MMLPALKIVIAAAAACAVTAATQGEMLTATFSGSMPVLKEAAAPADLSEAPDFGSISLVMENEKERNDSDLTISLENLLQLNMAFAPVGGLDGFKLDTNATECFGKGEGLLCGLGGREGGEEGGGEGGGEGTQPKP